MTGIEPAWPAWKAPGSDALSRKNAGRWHASRSDEQRVGCCPVGQRTHRRIVGGPGEPAGCVKNLREQVHVPCAADERPGAAQRPPYGEIDVVLLLKRLVPGR